MYCIEGFIFLTLVSSSISFPTVFAMSDSKCTANIVDNSYGTILQGCPAPPLFYGYGSPFTSSIETEVTEPGVVSDMILDWFLNEQNNPSLNITLDAQSPDSAQEYTINVLADYFAFPIYCGRISTKRPEGDLPQQQTISLELSCPPKTLTPNRNIVISIEVKGSRTEHVSYRSRLPSCNDDLMYLSTKCTEEREKRISFTLQQHGNSAKVVLSTRTAYQSNTVVHLAISKRDETAFRHWAPIGEERTLTFPQRTMTFNNLEIGATYQVTVWRPTEPEVRYAEIITLKPDAKVPDSNNFMRRLLEGSR